MRFEVLALCLLVCGCRFDALQDGAYRGEPLLRVSGTIQSGEGIELAPEVAERSRIAVFWVGDTENPVAQRQNISTNERSLVYEVELFEPPPMNLRWELPGVPGQVAYAYIVLYDDINGDQRWDPERESATGVTQDHVIGFATQALPQELLGRKVPSGFGLYALLECAENEDGELERPLMWIDPEEEAGRVPLHLQPSDDFLTPEFSCEGGEDPCVDAIFALELEQPENAAGDLDAIEQCFRDRDMELPSLCRGPWSALKEYEQTTTPTQRVGPISDLIECAELHIELRDL